MNTFRESLDALISAYNVKYSAYVVDEHMAKFMAEITVAFNTQDLQKRASMILDLVYSNLYHNDVGTDVGFEFYFDAVRAAVKCEDRVLIYACIDVPCHHRDAPNVTKCILDAIDDRCSMETILFLMTLIPHEEFYDAEVDIPVVDMLKRIEDRGRQQQDDEMIRFLTPLIGCSLYNYYHDEHNDGNCDNYVVFGDPDREKYGQSIKCSLRLKDEGAKTHIGGLIRFV